MKGAYKQARDPFFTWSNSDRKRKNGFKLKEVKFKLDIRKKFFTRGSEALEQVLSFYEDQHKEMTSPVPAEEQPHALRHAKVCPAGKQPFRKEPERAAGHQLEHKPEKGLCSKGIQLYPVS